MNRRLVVSGAISIAIAAVLLIIRGPLLMSMIGESSISSVVWAMSIYTYVGYAIGAVGLVLLFAGLLSKSHR